MTRQPERLSGFEVSGMVTMLGVSAAAWGVIMAIAPALQIRRMLVRRSSRDISLGYFAILLPGFGLWIGYGIAQNDWALVVPNVVAVTVGVVTVVVAVALRHPPRPPADDHPAEQSSDSPLSAAGGVG